MTRELDSAARILTRRFWDTKRETNQARDRKQSRALRKKGWTVLRLWEHDLAKKREKQLLAKLSRVLGMASRK